MMGPGCKRPYSMRYSYVQAPGDYATIYTVNAKYTIHVTMKAMDEKLPASEFSPGASDRIS
jgi:hypothetical protein